MLMKESKGQMGIKRRLGIVMLSLIVAVTMMPAFAFADLDPETVDINANMDSGTAMDSDTQLAQDPDRDAQSEQVTDADTDADADTTGPLTEEAIEFEAETNEDELPDSDELLQKYFDSRIDAETGTVLNDHSASESGIAPKTKLRAKISRRRDSLNSQEQAAYDQIKQYIQKIASGNMGTAEFDVDQFDNANYPRVMSALILDMPYEFYWYDKVIGYLHGETFGNKHRFILSVSKDYWDTSKTYNYRGLTIVVGLNTTKTKSTGKAVTTVSNIINYFADKDDYTKLCGYRDCICALVNYDRTAANAATAYDLHESTAPFYGDPWQLISVFDCSSDGKFDNTNGVVCEGYSKAFQYLCDRTSFTGDVECYTVQGDMYTGLASGSAPHMWNVVHIGDCNYIADITNSDSWSYSLENWEDLLLVVTDYKEYIASDDVFLSGWISDHSTIVSGYIYILGDSWIYYVYDDFTRGGNGVRGMFSEYELTLSNTAYDPNGSNPPVIHCSAKEPGCTEPGNIERWLKQGFYYKSADCSTRISYSATEISPLGHDWDSGTVIRAATEYTAGAKSFTCRRCGAAKEEGIPMLLHTHHYSASESLDYITYTCNVCGDSYKKSKVIVDLPKVSIKKPAGSKAGFTAKWKKLNSKKRKKIQGYEIQYSTNRSFPDTNSAVKTAAKSKSGTKIKKLAKKKNYYVRVRSYKWINGVKHVSKWSSIKKVKTK